MCLEKKLDKEHDKTPYGEWAGYYDDIFRFGGDNKVAWPFFFN